MAILFSIEFLLCFWMFFIVYWLLAPLPKVQNILLLIAGYYFVYLAGVYSLLILLSWSLCVWLLVKLTEKKNWKDKTPGILIFCMLMYFFIFKYYAPLFYGLQEFFDKYSIHIPLPIVDILLPLGLSFYLFNALSLINSVAKNEIKNPDLLSVLLYINFVPTLIAGPVNRASALLPQILATRRIILNFRMAFFLIALAMVKLFLLSAWLTDELVDPVFAMPDEHNGWETLIAMYSWAWNIYFNFSGYTNLVTGIAMLLGYRLPKNFDHPYLATSLKIFWRDWHVSLSTFIRDFIYFPLGGNRNGFYRTQINIIIAMVISGIWHGAGINFLLWGAIHGIGLVIYNLWHSWNDKIVLPDTVARLLTFHYVCFGWIFFRAATFDDAISLLGNIFHCYSSALTLTNFWILAFFIMLIIIYPGVINLKDREVELFKNMKWYALPLFLIPVLMIAFFFAPSGVPGFIYANF